MVGRSESALNKVKWQRCFGDIDEERRPKKRKKPQSILDIADDIDRLSWSAPSGVTLFDPPSPKRASTTSSLFGDESSPAKPTRKKGGAKTSLFDNPTFATTPTASKADSGEAPNLFDTPAGESDTPKSKGLSLFAVR